MLSVESLDPSNVNVFLSFSFRMVWLTNAANVATLLSVLL